MTIFTTGGDLIVFIKSLKAFGSEPEITAYRDLSMIFLSCAFLFIDYFYCLWIISMKHKFPSYLGLAVMKSALGAMEGIHKALGNKLI